MTDHSRGVFRRIPSAFTAGLLQKPARLRIAALFAAMTLTLLAIGLSDLSQWDELSASLSWRLADQQAVERRIVVVDIDEKSIQAIGAWP